VFDRTGREGVSKARKPEEAIAAAHMLDKKGILCIDAASCRKSAVRCR